MSDFSLGRFSMGDPGDRGFSLGRSDDSKFALGNFALGGFDNSNLDNSNFSMHRFGLGAAPVRKQRRNPLLDALDGMM